MKKLFAVLSFAFLVSCSDAENPTEVVMPDPQTCKPVETDKGVELHCPNSEPILLTNGNEGSCPTWYDQGMLFFRCPGEEVMGIPLTPAQSSPPQVVVGPQGEQGESGKDGVITRIWFDDEGCLWVETNDGRTIKVRMPFPWEKK